MEDSKKDYKSIVSSEAFPGILLLGATILALILAKKIILKILLKMIFFCFSSLMIIVLNKTFLFCCEYYFEKMTLIL